MERRNSYDIRLPLVIHNRISVKHKMLGYQRCLLLSRLTFLVRLLYQQYNEAVSYVFVASPSEPFSAQIVLQNVFISWPNEKQITALLPTLPTKHAGGGSLEKSRRDKVPSVFLSPAEKNGFPFVL